MLYSSYQVFTDWDVLPPILMALPGCLWLVLNTQLIVLTSLFSPQRDTPALCTTAPERVIVARPHYLFVGLGAVPESLMWNEGVDLSWLPICLSFPEAWHEVEYV